MRNYDPSFLLKVGLALCIGTILHLSSHAQCANSLATRTYDTSLTSNGFGIYNISAPQWSPDSGLLVSVKLSAVVSSQYGFTLRNADTLPAAFSLTLGQEDLISGSALSSTYNNIMSTFIQTYPLLPQEGVTRAPFAFLSNHYSTDSITGNVTPFLGTGQVNLSYMSFTYTNLNTANNATYYYSTDISNTMTFSVQYLYCMGGVTLAANLTRFSAAAAPPRSASLSWSAVNEAAGRVYDIQRSGDSKTFTTVGSVPATGSEESADYAYTDNLPDSGTDSWYYRLQIHDEGNLTFSPVRQVTIASTAKTLQVYPNPATSYINLITGQAAGNWQVDIFAANGNLVQRATILESSTLHLDFTNHLAAGTYFVRLLDLHSGKNYTTSFIITGN